jgi:hypothetical protein
MTNQKNTKEFTLTRALVELKLYDSKIEKAIKYLKPVSYAINKIVVDYRQTKEEFLDNYKAQMQSVSDLRKNKTTLKNALMKANAETIVKIGEKEYTILEALNRKNDIRTEQMLISQLKNHLNNAIARTENIKNDIESNIEKTINSRSSSSSNQSKDYVQTIRDSYKDQMPELVNADVVEKLITEKEAEITEFIAEVDFALSEINAITKIKVQLA